jgi:aspartate/tyrosine/aromatic aminotransferase
MFNHIQTAPPDPILGLEEAFKRNPNQAKINLTAGVYRDETGNTPIFRAVKQAEAEILEHENSKTYLGIIGSPEYGRLVQELLFVNDHPVVESGRAVTAHAPGGTGALRIGAEFIKRANPDCCVWISEPSWPNHPGVMKAAGLCVERYPYFDPAGNCVDFDAMMASLNRAAPGDVVVLHGSCHNPTGADLRPEQWELVAELLAERGVIPFIDFAYQGFAHGLREDALGLSTLAERLPEMVIASSFSKNFGLYNERVGALTLLAGDRSAAEASLSQIKTIIRTNYSNPPAHGSAIVTAILNSAYLRSEWKDELAKMRERIHEIRRAFVHGLAAAGVARDYSFIERQNGMFSFTGLNKEQVHRLREEHAIYMVDTGRMNVAGLSQANLSTVCRAIAAVS